MVTIPDLLAVSVYDREECGFWWRRIWGYPDPDTEEPARASGDHWALLSSQINTKHIYSFKTGEIHFESVEEIPWTLDGEFGGEHDSVCIKNAKQALKIVVPEEEQ